MSVPVNTATWDTLWHPQRSGWRDRLLALFLGLAYLVWLLGTVEQLGYARDEGFYFQAANRYQQWFSLLLSQPAAAFAEVDRYWIVNHEHPALIKSLFAVSHWLLHDKLGLFSLEGTSYRFPAMALGGLGVGLLYLWGARISGRACGLLAAFWLAAMPRFFFHAHLACFDVPIVTIWLVCAYCYWRSLERGGWRASLLCGLAFGLALNSKHNSWFLPIVCAAHAAALWLLGGKSALGLKRVRRAGRSLLCMSTVGPLLFFATWPWIWHDTGLRLQQYAQFHLQHVYYNMEFLGQNYFRPPMPRGYAFVMTGATLPLVPLAAFVVGAAAGATASLRWLWRRLPGNLHVPHQTGPKDDWCSRRRMTWLFWALAIAVQYAAWLRPGTPIFGGTKHWMTAYPFMMLIAASVVATAFHRLHRAARERYADAAGNVSMRAGAAAKAGAVMALLALVIPSVWQAQRSNPWGLSWYNGLVGGAAGAASIGLNRGFWGYSTLVLADHINARMPPGGRIFIHDTAHQSWSMLVREGRMRKDILLAPTPAGADMAVYHHERHMAGVEYQQWDALGTVVPSAVAGIDGVPVLWLYESRRLRQSTHR